MKAIQIEHFGIDGLRVNEIKKPQVQRGKVLIRVKAASLNNLSLLVVKGLFNDKLTLPHIPLTDVSGVVEEVGNSAIRHFGNSVSSLKV